MLAEFYRGVLPSTGHYALFLASNKQHVWCDSLDDLAHQTESRAGIPDIYFAVNSFETPTRRTADNALLSRAFYFDIDAGPEKFAKHGDKVYPTRREALADVIRWCQQSTLVPSYIIASGAGLHVYFLLDHDVTIAEWGPVAVGLKARALAEGLRIDAAVTSDAARILRPVGSLHNNGTTVHSLKALNARYKLETVKELVAPWMARAPRERGINDDILEAPSGPPKSVEKIATRCAAMKHAMDQGGNVSEPYWRAMLGVIKFTVEGDAAAHKYSQGHPDYDFNATQDKFDRWQAGPSTCATLEAENPGACASCEFKGKVKSPVRLGELEPPEAARLAPAPEPAPPAVEEASPFDVADTVTPDESPWDGFLPDGFRVAHKGRTYFMVWRHKVQTVNEAGDKVEMEIDSPFAAVPFWVESWAPGSSGTDQAMAIYGVYDTQRRRVDRFTLPTRHAARKDTLFGVLAEQNIQVYPSTNNARNAMEEFVKASLERIRSAGQRPKIFERFGTMYDAKGGLMVAQGKHIIQPDGSVVEGVVQEKLRSRSGAYSIPLPENPRGVWGADVWATHVLPRAKRHIEYLQEFYGDDNYLPYQLAIMLSWASPMMAFMQGTYRPGTPLPGIGLTVTLYSPKSGVGKTSAMHAAALAFGAPNAVCLQLDRNSSTDRGRQTLVLQSGTMPCFMDEMEDVPATDMAALVSAVGNGASRVYLEKDRAVGGAVPLALINVMSTNKSHRELVAADRTESAAVQMRLLEIECSEIRPASADQALRETEARSNLFDCAGAVGAIIHQAMIRMGQDELNKLGIRCSDLARTALDGKQDGRLMWRALGAMLAVRRILQSLGLKVFDGDKLKAEFKKWHDMGYEFSRDNTLPSGGTELMALFLSDIAGNTLVTKSENQVRGIAASVDVLLNSNVPTVVAARAVLDAQCVYVKTAAVREWCLKRKVSYVNIIRGCRLAGALDILDGTTSKTSFQIDLFKGTLLARGVRDSVIKVWTHRLPPEVLNMHKAQGNVVQLRQGPEAAPDSEFVATEGAAT